MGAELLASTGAAAVDRLLRGAMALLDLTFPGRILSVYLSGSYAAGDAGAGSDVDGLVVFRGELAPAERDRFREMLLACSLVAGQRLDLAPRGEAHLLRDGELPAKAAARVLLYGEDIRPRLPPMPLLHYTLLMMQGACFYLGHVRGRPAALTYPLSYPDPADEFYGYSRDGWYGLTGWAGPGTKALVGGATLAATSLVAMRTGHAAVSSGESVAAYRQRIGDEWADWLEELYEHGKRRWGYAVPSRPADRRRLRRLCARALAFENHFLASCRPYLLAELERADERTRARLIEALGRVR